MGRYIDVSPKARIVTRERCNGDDNQFASAYYQALSEARDRTKGEMPDSQTLNQKSNAQIAQMINKRYASMRNIIDAQMMDYLIRHEGRIDSWPVPADLDGMMQFSCGKSGDMKESLLYFDYFGQNYTAKAYEIVRADEELEYRDTYQCPNTQEYDDMKSRLLQLDRQAQAGGSKGKIRMGAVRTILALVGLVLLAFSIILQLRGGAMMEGWLTYLNGAVDKEFDSLVNVLTVIVSIPAWVALKFSLLLREWSIDMCGNAWVLPGSAMILCLLPALRTCLRRSRQKKRLRACDEARAEASALRASDEYRAVIQRNDEFREKQSAMSEEWHRAWYSYCLAVRMLADANKKVREDGRPASARTSANGDDALGKALKQK